MRTRRIGVLAGVLSIVLIACSSSSPAAAPANPNAAPANGPGSAEVYARIAGMTDCGSLQAEFDMASTSHDMAMAGSPEREWTLGYMQAAHARMQTVGCYK